MKSKHTIESLFHRSQLSTLNSQHSTRRAHLGLAVHGPFSRNHRRQPWREFTPHLTAAALLTALAAFILALFR